MRARIVLTLTAATLLCAACGEHKTVKSVGNEIRKVDLITPAYYQAVKDFGDGIQDFHAEVSYGDLLGDGQEDAAVTVHCRFGPAASANPSDVYVYTLRKGHPELVAHAGNGEKAHGGICSAYICCDSCDLTCGGDIQGNGQRRLLVQRYRPDEKDCNACYGFVEEVEFEFRGMNLISVNTKTTPVEKLDPSDACAIHNTSEKENKQLRGASTPSGEPSAERPSKSEIENAITTWAEKIPMASSTSNTGRTFNFTGRLDGYTINNEFEKKIDDEIYDVYDVEVKIKGLYGVQKYNMIVGLVWRGQRWYSTRLDLQKEPAIHSQYQGQ